MVTGPDLLEVVVTHFGYQAPFLLACLIGMILAWRNMRRAMRPAVLTLVALIVMFVVALAATSARCYLFVNLTNNQGNAFDLLTAVGIADVILQASALVLLSVAVFVGRPVAAESTDD